MPTSAQLTVSVGGNSFPVFLQQGFFDTSPSSAPVHKHRYTEVHLVCKGKYEFLVGDQKVCATANQAIILPPESFHRCIYADPQGIYPAFQIDRPRTAPTVKTLPAGVLAYLADRIPDTDPGKLSAALGLICGEIFDLPAEMEPLRDPAFIISEQLGHHYDSDLSLTGIAEELGLSKKQTERLIRKYTGTSFRNEVTRRRMEAARHLIETEDISLAQAAERVGYKSYSGFWKAFHGEKK